MATLDGWSEWCSDVHTDPDPEWYTPELHVTGSTRPFSPAPVVIARPSPAAERPGPEGNFLEGFACGFALALPLWFALTALVLWLAGR